MTHSQAAHRNRSPSADDTDHRHLLADCSEHEGHHLKRAGPAVRSDRMD